MATQRWLGRALSVAQISTITIGGTIATSDTFTVTINGRSITYTAIGGDGTDDVAAGLQALLDASTVTEFTEATYTVASSVVTATADTAGVPITFAVSKSSASGTISLATPTAATGPNHWDDDENWSTGSAPVNSDDVYIDNSAVSILYGLDQSAVTLTSLTIGASFTGTVGLPKTNASGYPEYRDDYLQIGATTVKAGTGEGSGASRIKINFGSVQTGVEIQSTGSSEEFGIPAVLIIGTHASNTIDVVAGSVGVAVFGGESATVATLTHAQAADVLCGAGCTLTTVAGTGQITINSAATTITQSAGLVTVIGSGAVTTLTLKSGQCTYRSSGTITTATIGGVLDCSQDSTARTITNCTLRRGGQILDPHSTITYTNGIGLDGQVNNVAAA